MAVGSIIKRGQKYLRQRKFSKAIDLLEPRICDYKDSFSFFYTLGVACLYAGDYGGATDYFSAARRIRPGDTNLLLAQSALCLQNKDIPRALQYCMDARYKSPGNKQVNKVLEFIKNNGEAEILVECIDNGKIKKIYPPLGTSPTVYFSLAAVLGCVVLALFGINFAKKAHQKAIASGRADLSEFVLSFDERKNAAVDEGIFHYELSSAEVVTLYENAQKSFQKSDDNSAQIYCNMILNSNASSTLKAKTELLQRYLWNPKPTFDSLKTRMDYKDIKDDYVKYLGCYVEWSGRLANMEIFGDTAIFDLLVGYDVSTKVAAVVPVRVSTDIAPDLSKPAKILGIIGGENERLCVNAVAIYQPLGANWN